MSDAALFVVDADGVRLPPVVGYSAMVVDGAVGLALLVAQSRDQLAAGQGEVTQVSLAPAAAIELGRALVERGELALRPRDATLS